MDVQSSSRCRVAYRIASDARRGLGGDGPPYRRSRHPQRWLCSLSFIRGARGGCKTSRAAQRYRFCPIPRPRRPAPALSIRPRVLSSRAYGHLRQKVRLNDMTPQLKIPAPDPCAAAPRRSLMNPPAESHSVEIALPRRDALVHAGGKNKLFVTIKMVNQTNFSNCEVKLWSGSARRGWTFWTRMIFNGPL